MKDVAGLTASAMKERIAELEMQLKLYQSRNLDLNMARGKPCSEQLDLSNDMLNIPIPIERDPNKDLRNYGTLDGLPETKKMFADIFEVKPSKIIVGGNSSLRMMYTTLAKSMLYGTYDSERPWKEEEVVKFICPVPGYDRHFTISEQLGIEMISVEMDDNGPYMDEVEALVKNDPSIKGMWCVPKYSNPSGITYSSEVVKRLASMETAAKDFKLIWDNAYIIHDLYDTTVVLDNIMDACAEAGNPHRAYMFTSMSKVTFAGAAVAAMAGSESCIQHILKIMGVQTIGSDKINQYRHAAFLKDLDGITAHMKNHAGIIRPKFKLVLELLEKNFSDGVMAQWSNPMGGYFINLDLKDSSAKEVVAMAASTGLKLTAAGATFPYKKDPNDSNIRLAPTFPPLEELETAIEILCVCIELVYFQHQVA